jgi:hypothetical protein
VHVEGDTERFYRQMPVPALIGIEATGKLSLAGRPAGGIGPRVMGGRRGADPGQLCEAAENRQPDAEDTLKLLPEGRFPRILAGFC